MSFSKEDPDRPTFQSRPRHQQSQQSLAHSHYGGIGSKCLPLQLCGPLSPAILSSSLIYIFSSFEQGVGCSSRVWWTLRTTSCRASCWAPRVHVLVPVEDHLTTTTHAPTCGEPACGHVLAAHTCLFLHTHMFSPSLDSSQGGVARRGRPRVCMLRAPIRVGVR